MEENAWFPSVFKGILLLFFKKKTLSGLSLTGPYGGVKEGKEEKLQPLVGFYSNMRATVFFWRWVSLIRIRMFFTVVSSCEDMPECTDFESEMKGIGFSKSKSLSGSRQCSQYGAFDNDPDFNNDPDFDSCQCQGEEIL